MTAEGRVETARADRYLVQLCLHLSELPPRHGMFLHGRHRPPKVLHVEWTDVTGEVRFQNGACTLEARDDAVYLHLSTDDEAALTGLQQAISHRIETIGRREQLTVAWGPLPTN